MLGILHRNNYNLLPEVCGDFSSHSRYSYLSLLELYIFGSSENQTHAAFKIEYKASWLLPSHEYMEYVSPMYTLTDNMRDLIPKKKILCREKNLSPRHRALVYCSFNVHCLYFAQSNKWSLQIKVQNPHPPE